MIEDKDVWKAEAGRELDARVAAEVFGYTVQMWSFHVINSADEVRGRNFRHGVGSMHAFANNRFPAEVLLDDAEGDMPGWEMCVDGELQPIPCYSDDKAGAWWPVVIELRRLGVWTHITTHLHVDGVSVTMGVPSSECQAVAETAALAVSRCSVIAARKFADTIAAYRERLLKPA